MEINDSIISGELLSHESQCPVCGQQTRCIRIIGLMLPVYLTVGATILADRDHGSKDGGYPVLPRVGLGCGCYAKFHRQLVHITERMAVSRG